MAQNKFIGLVKNALKYHSLDDYPGFCYFALLPDGAVKIGFTHTYELFENRMKSLSRQYKAPVIPLRVVKGGFVAEAFYHDMFAAYRIAGGGERFVYSPAMAEFLSQA